jgi:hypothetical protein
VAQNLRRDELPAGTFPVWIYLLVGLALDARGVAVFGTQSLSGPAELW